MDEKVAQLEAELSLARSDARRWKDASDANREHAMANEDERRRLQRELAAAQARIKELEAQIANEAAPVSIEEAVEIGKGLRDVEMGRVKPFAQIREELASHHGGESRHSSGRQQGTGMGQVQGTEAAPTDETLDAIGRVIDEIDVTYSRRGRAIVNALIERGVLMTPERVDCGHLKADQFPSPHGWGQLCRPCEELFNRTMKAKKSGYDDAMNQAEARVQAAVAAALEMEKVKRERENTR